MSKTASNFFSKKETENITAALKSFEKNTSGEIRVHIEDKCQRDLMDRTATLFQKLGMNKTQLRNGVLFYIAVKSRKFAIIGDAGINMHVGEGFWTLVKSKMTDYFEKELFCEGLIEGIKMAGDELQKFYPHRQGDINELPDEISYS